jgi:putative protein kinase ArgK-like GTPase of G3E family
VLVDLRNVYDREEAQPAGWFIRALDGRGSANEGVKQLWKSVAPELAKQTKQAIRDYGHKPDMLGKNRGHWTNMHQTVELHILRQRMRETGGKIAA